MLKNRLLYFLGDMEGPSSFAEFRHMLSADVLRFHDSVEIPTDPEAAYGHGWHTTFRLPRSPVGIEDSKSLIILEDAKPGSISLGAERRFFFVQPLPRPMFPVDFYLAWGRCWMSFTTAPLRINAKIDKMDEWFVGEPGSEFTDGLQMACTMRTCNSMIGPGITTAVEQLALLANRQ